jgi:hypothetical protein
MARREITPDLARGNGAAESNPRSRRRHQRMVRPQNRFWKVPPELYASLDSEFNFDFDPCPMPRPDGYNSLVLPWGKRNYVNPPFNKKDAPFGGPAAFVRKAIEERSKGNTSVFILPLPWNLGLLMKAGAEMRYGGIVRWLDVETGELCPRKAPQVIAILRPNDTR